MKKLYFLFYLLLSFISNAQNPADIEHSFGGSSGFNGYTNTIAIQPDGKIILGGHYTTYQGNTEIRIIRLNSDGTKDPTFISGTGFDGGLKAIALQKDGKIIVGGHFTNYQGITANYIIRLNSDGSKDSSFNTGTGFSTNITCIAIQPDGKIIVGGQFYTYQGITQNRITRLNSDGSRDTTFNIGIGFNTTVASLAIQPDGKIMVVGGFYIYQGIRENRIIRLNSDGSKDTTFNSGIGFDFPANTIAVQTDGKIIVGGGFTSYQGISENSMIRLNSNGSRDNTFNTGTGVNEYTNWITLQTDGKIIVAGATSSQGVRKNRIIRLNSDGSKDTTFETGTGFDKQIFSVAIQNNGKIIVAGEYTTYKDLTSNSIIRLNNDGNKDVTFCSQDGFNEEVKSIAVQTDQKVVCGGKFNSYKGISENRIIRFNNDGTKDITFNTGTGFNNTVTKIVLQADGKIIVGGNFTTYKGVTENSIIRLNSDGSKDTTFNTGTGIIGPGYNDAISTITLQSDGKIIVGGYFSKYQGVTENYIIRLNSDGSKDSTFNTNIGFNYPATSVAVQSDGKIIIGGHFTSYKENTETRIIRLNSDGSKDSTFNSGTGLNGLVNTIALQPDGKIILGGYFTSYQGITANRIIRLNNDGIIDTGFNSGTGFNKDVLSIALQTNGKIIVGGLFTTYQGVSENYIVSLNNDGTRDTSFDTGIGFDSGVNVVKIQSDEKIIVGGSFKSYQGKGVSVNLIRLKGIGTNLSNPVFNKKENLFSIWPNPVQNNLNVNSFNNSVPTATIYDLQGKLLYSKQSNLIDVSSLRNGIYLIKLKNETGEVTQKFIKQ
jgi:uncharacterized delta-60 repeat protein